MARDLASLKAVLANSRLQKDNNPAYQVILGLIDNLEETDRTVTSISSGSGGGGGGGGGGSTTSEVPLILMLSAHGKKSVPESTGGSSEDSFVSSLFLGGM
jgi:hypothetical protein